MTTEPQETTPEELLAILGERAPYTVVTPYDQQAVLTMHRRVFAARRAIAEEHGWTVAELLRLEVEATALGRLR